MSKSHRIEGMLDVGRKTIRETCQKQMLINLCDHGMMSCYSTRSIDAVGGAESMLIYLQISTACRIESVGLFAWLHYTAT